MVGDGFTFVYHCESADLSDLTVEPDAPPVYCEELGEDEHVIPSIDDISS